MSMGYGIWEWLLMSLEVIHKEYICVLMVYLDVLFLFLVLFWCSNLKVLSGSYTTSPEKPRSPT